MTKLKSATFDSNSKMRAQLSASTYTVKGINIFWKNISHSRCLVLTATIIIYANIRWGKQGGSSVKLCWSKMKTGKDGENAETPAGLRFVSNIYLWCSRRYVYNVRSFSGFFNGYLTGHEITFD